MRAAAVRLGASLVLVVASSALAAGPPKGAAKPAPKPAAPPVNVTGTWSSNIQGGAEFRLHQEGSRVWGQDHTGYLVRGSWTDGRLVLFYRYDLKPDSPRCSALEVVIVKSKGTATRLEGVTFLEDGRASSRTLIRSSPEAGAEMVYPYGVELTKCGSLPTYELEFDVASDVLKGTDWPLLAAVADLLKKETALKIKVLGHTDSTGDAEKNRDLSGRRAAAVKKILVEKYGADPARVDTKGWGADQPIAPNEDEQGRALNRRVEIVVVR